MPFGLQLAYFIRFYGQDAYQNQFYPTSDHIIPYKLFWILSKAMKHAMAMERLNDTQAIASAIGMATSGTDPAVQRMIEAETKEALGEE